jgi:hypothetical protein
MVRFKSSAAFVTIGPDHPLWKTAPGDVDAPRAAFVRLVPPEDASDEQIGVLRGACRAVGAVVRVSPRPRRGIVRVSSERSAEKPTTNVREVIRVLASKASVTDGPALMTLVESIMDEARL